MSNQKVNVNLRSRMDRQIIVYTNADKSEDMSFPLPPRALITTPLDQDQISYIREHYGRQVIIN